MLFACVCMDIAENRFVNKIISMPSCSKSKQIYTHNANLCKYNITYKLRCSLTITEENIYIYT